MRRVPRRVGPLAPACLVVLLLALALPAAAPPAVPMRIQGHAYDRLGVPLPPGTPIRAFVDGVDYSNGSAVYDGSGSYSILVGGNPRTGTGASETPTIKEGADPGEVLVLVAGDFLGATNPFQEAVAWSEGAVTTRDLHLATVVSTPSPLKIQGIVTNSTFGGNETVHVCNPTTATVSLAPYFLEVDRPGTYHGGSFDLAGALGPGETAVLDLGRPGILTESGDALKLVFRNPGGANASAGGRDLAVDRVEFNATSGGTLSWEPGNTILQDAPAPGPGEILERWPACVDTDEPADFRVTLEPGLQNRPPAVTVTSPVAGQVVAGGERVVVAWTMVDDFSPLDKLRVWVNASFGGRTEVIVSGELGVTAANWTVPEVDRTAASVTVEVVDPLGGRGNATSGAFTIVRPGLPAWAVALIAILLILLIGFFLWYGWKRGSRGIETTVPTRVEPPARPATPPATAPAPLSAASEPPPETPRKKFCPRCGTAVNAEDATCFFCGNRFVPPP